MSLVQRIVDWWVARRQRRDNRRFRDGFDMAARQLKERGRDAAIDLENEVDAAQIWDYQHNDPFDQGVRAAIHRWRQNRRHA